LEAFNINEFYMLIQVAPSRYIEGKEKN